MRRITYRKMSARETILAMFDRLITGEYYTLTTGKVIGDLDAAIDAFLLLCEQHIDDLN